MKIALLILSFCLSALAVEANWVALEMTKSASLAFTEVLVKSGINEVALEGYDPKAPLTDAACTARVLRPAGGNARLANADNSIRCEFRQTDPLKKGKAVLKMSEEGIGYWNSQPDEASFDIAGPLSAKFSAALEKLIGTKPVDDPTFTQADRVILEGFRDVSFQISALPEKKGSDGDVIGYDFQPLSMECVRQYEKEKLYKSYCLFLDLVK